MAKLHELLAVEGDLEGTYKKIMAETINTFVKKPEHFLGWVRTLDFFDEDAPKVAPEYHELTTTVQAKLDYQDGHIIRYLDAVLQKESTNQKACADIVIDGVVIAADIPATFLLGLENKLKLIRKTYEGMPTLSPGVKWKEDTDKGSHIYVTAHPVESFKPEKVTEPVILYEATKEHPAQVKEATKTINIGRYVKTTWCGAVTPAEKSKLLGRIDTLLRSVKKARQRANTVEVEKVTIGELLFDFIHSDNK